MEEQQQNQLITYKRKNRHALSNTASDDSRLNIDPQYLNLYQEQKQVPEGNAAIGDDVRNTYKPLKKKQKQKQGVKKKSIQSNVADSENAMTNHQGFSIIKTKSWSGILRHRMAVKGLMHLVERLDYEQYSAIMETGFGGFLAVRTNCIPKQLARWLLEHFDPWDNSLKLANHKVLELTEEDVHASLGLPMGPQEVIEAKQVDNDIQYIQILENWRARWNVKSGGLPIGTMDETILERGDHGADFKRDFIVYVISTCIMGNANGTCHFRILKSLLDVDRIDNYNWCAYVIKCLNETVVDWQADRTKYFTGPLLFLMDSGAYTPVSDSIEKTCDDDILSQDDDVFRDPEFLETLFHVESEAVEYFQKKKSMGVTPPSVGLSISSKKGACLSPTLPFTPPSFSLGFSPKKEEVASSHEQHASNGREHPTSLKESNKENMSPNIIAESRLQHSSGNQFSRKAPCNKSSEKILRVPRDPPQDKDKMVAIRQ